eukprot:gene12698-1369_t
MAQPPPRSAAADELLNEHLTLDAAFDRGLSARLRSRLGATKVTAPRTFDGPDDDGVMSRADWNASVREAFDDRLCMDTGEAQRLSRLWGSRAACKASAEQDDALARAEIELRSIRTSLRDNLDCALLEGESFTWCSVDGRGDAASSFRVGGNPDEGGIATAMRNDEQFPVPAGCTPVVYAGWAANFDQRISAGKPGFPANLSGPFRLTALGGAGGLAHKTVTQQAAGDAVESAWMRPVLVSGVVAAQLDNDDLTLVLSQRAFWLLTGFAKPSIDDPKLELIFLAAGARAALRHAVSGAAAFPPLDLRQLFVAGVKYPSVSGAAEIFADWTAKEAKQRAERVAALASGGGPHLDASTSGILQQFADANSKLIEG